MISSNDPGLPPAGPIEQAVTVRIALHQISAEVTAPDPRFSRPLAIVFDAFPAAPEAHPGQFTIEISASPTGGPPWVVSLGSRSFAEGGDPSVAARRAEWLFISEALPLWTRYVHVHAAVVATDERSLLLVGESGAGKSTTSVALALAGLDLFTDDVALIDPTTLRPLCVPRPIKLDARARRLLGARGLVIPAARRIDESIARTALPGLPPVERPGPPLVAALFLASERRPHPSLRPLTAAEAAMRFVRQSSERFDPTSGLSERAIAIVNAIARYELVAGDLDATVDTIVRLLRTTSDYDQPLWQ